MIVISYLFPVIYRTVILVICMRIICPQTRLLLQQTFETWLWDIAFRNIHIVIFCQFSQSMSCQHQNDPAYSVLFSDVDFVNKN